MSVNHYMLAVTDQELASILRTPEEIRELVERRSADVRGLGENGLAIVALTAEDGDDPLGFIRNGGPDAFCGTVGRYREEGGRVIEEDVEVDMGYGPASYYRNGFLVVVAEKLEPILPPLFAAHCDLDWLEQHHVYPGDWQDEGRKEELVDAFERYRACVLAAAASGQHLLVWCA